MMHYFVRRLKLGGRSIRPERRMIPRLSLIRELIRRLVTLAARLAVVALGALAVFVRVELEAMTRRAWHRIACAWMQCDEAAG